MKKYCFGVDVGGTTIKLGLFTVEGELLEKWEIPTRTENHSILLKIRPSFVLIFRSFPAFSIIPLHCPYGNKKKSSTKSFIPEAEALPAGAFPSSWKLKPQFAEALLPAGRTALGLAECWPHRRKSYISSS